MSTRRSKFLGIRPQNLATGAAHFCDAFLKDIARPRALELRKIEIISSVDCRSEIPWLDALSLIACRMAAKAGVSISLRIASEESSSEGSCSAATREVLKIRESSSVLTGLSDEGRFACLGDMGARYSRAQKHTSVS